MNFKKKYFFISITIIFLITQVVTFSLFYFLVYKLEFFKSDIWTIVFFSIFELLIFFLLSKEILEPIFKSEENIKKTIKNTLHELNIPVSTIKLNLDLLRDLKEEKYLKRVERIKKANENLIKLYNNMEYELKKELERVDLEEFYLKDALNSSIEKFEEQLEKINLEINIENPTIYCDYFGFIIVLDNLLSNAIKYNSENNPYIKIEQEGYVLSIYNHGTQILPENIMLVFERYFQENSLNKGYGIGLTVVKEFCDKYKISININSEEQGNTIVLNLKNIIK
ncbi:HAMP domain-containing sensor histidine kinase [Arcobacter sp. CECT 9188]|uniref:sensor histidine kinase n=1 Tax=Arcobacter sp. CECT 9188 TaxID=2044505 RepID=UPI000DEBE55B|nr:HAMP domain-containing sensor histidine kinase [Arcobacter sp. CECT 9188]RBQ25926.1 histidine kinase [Arcobacter sp. CECT 9188]